MSSLGETKQPLYLLRSWGALVVWPSVVWTHGSPGGSRWSRRAVWAWTSMSSTGGAVWAAHRSDGSLKTQNHILVSKQA